MTKDTYTSDRVFDGVRYLNEADSARRAERAARSVQVAKLARETSEQHRDALQILADVPINHAADDMA